MAANADSGSLSNLVAIPAGKRLVIETVSFQSIGLSGNKELGFLTVKVTAGAGTPNGPTTASHVIPGVIMAVADPTDNYIGGIGAFHMYADAGSQVVLTYTRGPVSGFSPQINVSITGYFVNLP